VDVDVVRRVVAAVPGQFDALAADLQPVAVGERSASAYATLRRRNLR
jgi:hypothetical protein